MSPDPRPVPCSSPLRSLVLCVDPRSAIAQLLQFPPSSSNSSNSSNPSPAQLPAPVSRLCVEPRSAITRLLQLPPSSSNSSNSSNPSPGQLPAPVSRLCVEPRSAIARLLQLPPSSSNSSNSSNPSPGQLPAPVARPLCRPAMCDYATPPASSVIFEPFEFFESFASNPLFAPRWEARRGSPAASAPLSASVVYSVRRIKIVCGPPPGGFRKLLRSPGPGKGEARAGGP
jgi:hypothetical protein